MNMTCRKSSMSEPWRPLRRAIQAKCLRGFDPKATSRMDIIMGLMLNEDNYVFDVIHDDGGDSAHFQILQIR